MSIFVTDGNERVGLAVVRALGKSGLGVTVGAPARTSLAASSRYCHDSVRYPSPLDAVEEFRGFLLTEMRTGRYDCLLPLTDATLTLAAQMRDSLEKSVSLPIPSLESALMAQDKRKMLLLGSELGIACPKTYLLEEGENVEQIAKQILHPVVIKPRFSRLFRNGQWETGIIQYAEGPSDLLAKYRASEARLPGPIIQEKIEGEGRGVFLLVWNAELKAAFCHRRLREKPPWGGVSVYRESLPLDHELVKKSFHLLQAINWQGAAMVEYKVDDRDGQPKLMEVNGRFWGSLQLALDAGMNFPLLLYRLASGEDVPAQFEYRVGTKSRWLCGDIASLLIRIFHSGRMNSLSSRKVPLWRACAEFLKFWEKDLHYEIWRLEDQSPGWFECKAYAIQTWQRLLGEDRSRSDLFTRSKPVGV